MCIMSKPPLPPHVRVTVPVSPEVHAAFQRMAEASGMSVGRCMGEWLADTQEGVEFVTAQLVKARTAPRQVVKDLRQMALGGVDVADDLLRELRAGGQKPPAEGSGAPRPAAAGPSPRPVIRGGNSSGKTRTHLPTGGKS